jgi:hypothetical protein
LSIFVDVFAEKLTIDATSMLNFGWDNPSSCPERPLLGAFRVNNPPGELNFFIARSRTRVGW